MCHIIRECLGSDILALAGERAGWRTNLDAARERQACRRHRCEFCRAQSMLKAPLPNYAEIARKLHVSVGSVSQHARRLGLPSRREKALKHYEEIEKLVGEKGQAGAARKLGVSRQCVHGCLVKLARLREGGF